MTLPPWGKAAGALLLGALAVFLLGWFVRGAKDRAALERERQRQQHVADSIDAAYRPRLDSIAAAERASAERARRDSITAAALRREAAQHAEQDRALDAALTAAGTLADSFRVAITQRNAARTSYTLAVIADSTARRGARARIADLDSLHQVRLLADSLRWSARVGALEKRNQQLALDLANRDRFLGLIDLHLPGWVDDVLMVGAGVYLGCRAAGKCKVP